MSYYWCVNERIQGEKTCRTRAAVTPSQPMLTICRPVITRDWSKSRIQFELILQKRIGLIVIIVPLLLLLPLLSALSRTINNHVSGLPISKCRNGAQPFRNGPTTLRGACNGPDVPRTRLTSGPIDFLQIFPPSLSFPLSLYRFVLYKNALRKRTYRQSQVIIKIINFFLTINSFFCSS